MADENDQVVDPAQVTDPANPQVTDPANPNDPPADPFAALAFEEGDKDIRDWITKTGFKGPKDIAKTAFEQSKLIGSSIRVPGENATDEERNAFLDKLGRPKEAKDYAFTPPTDLPEDLPYDGERADEFKAKAHELGLTAKQAAGLHDWFASKTVEDFNGIGQQNAAKQLETAQAQTKELEKLWGPLDGKQMRTNLAFADKALKLGGEEVLNEFKRVGLIGGDGKVIQSAPIATMLAKIGQTLYTEDAVLRGNPDMLGNPFSSGKEGNLTEAMKLIKSDRAHAFTLIAAAGRKPSDFGLKDD